MARIAFLIPNLVAGGAERVALTLVTALAERDHDVDLLLMEQRGGLLELVPPNVRLFDLKAPRVRNVLRPLIRYLRERRPDAIQVSMWPLTVVGIIAARLARVPVRVVVSDHVSLSRQYAKKRLTIALLKLTTRLFYPLADARVCVSRGNARNLASLSGLAQERFTTIYNPVRERETLRAACDLEKDWSGRGPRILSVGTLKAQKNHALLIESFARLPRELDATLVIAGEGELRGSLERKVDELGLTGKVKFAGHVEQLGKYYQTADLFVLSSDYEGFALVLVEALHAGLRIVSTDCPDGPAEILDHGRYGILVPVGDAARLAEAMEEALAAPSKPEEQRRRAARFSVERATDEYLRLMLTVGQSPVVQ